MKKGFSIILAFLSTILIAQGQDSLISSSNRINPEEFLIAGSQKYTLNGNLPFKETEIQPLETAIFGTAFTAYLTTQHIWQMRTIWKEQTDFKIIEDGWYSMGADKIGHLYGSYLTAQYIQEGLYTSGFGYHTAAVTSACIGFAYSSYIEVMDGFGKNWGFSPSDFYFDAAGALFFLSQHYLPYLQNITPKFSYIPCEWYGEYSRKEAAMFNDDYSSQTFWFSFNVYNMLPENLKKYWIEGIDISIGYAVHGLHENQNAENDYAIGKSWLLDEKTFTWGSRKVILALDYNLVTLIPESRYNFVNWLKQNLNYFKFPSPAIEYGIDSKETRFYLVYPF